MSEYTVRILPYNEVYVKIEAEKAILQELREKFSFFADNYKFHPKFKNRIWDGKINLIDFRSNTIYKGLCERIEAFCNERGYAYADEVTPADEALSLSELNSFLDELKLPDWLERRDYQLQAILTAIRKRRKILLSPTSSGKSFIIYCLLRWYQKKTLLIVPTVMLTTQMYKDFAEYSQNDPTWNVDDEVSTISAGKEKYKLNGITVSTWQSLQNMPREWFDDHGFEVVVVDEAHTAQGSAIRKIMENLVDTPIRIGTTGTMQDAAVHEFVLTGLFGEAKQVIKTSELIEADQASQLSLKCLIFQYSPETMKAVKKFDYQEEIKFITSHVRRNKFIANLALSLHGNTLVMCNLVEHVRAIEELLIAKNTDKKIYVIMGEIDPKVREEIRTTVEREGKDCIIVCTSGTMSTGVNIVSLHNLILAHPSKAKIRLLQSIGRILRRSVAKGKFEATLFDLSDELTLNKKKNYTFDHFLERLKIYIRESFKYKIKKVNLE